MTAALSEEAGALRGRLIRAPYERGAQSSDVEAAASPFGEGSSNLG